MNLETFLVIEAYLVIGFMIGGLAVFLYKPKRIKIDKVLRM